MTESSPHIFLSLCMPTYNFGRFIGETLESILPQLRPDIEIVIVDGASTDDTSEVVARYQKRTPQIQYHRLPVKGGIDHDMKQSIELARGKYCWLFSSDDILNPGAIEEMLSKIEEEIDAYICGFDIYDFNLRKFIVKHPILNFERETTLNLSDPSQRIAFFKSALTTTAFFSFMSSLIIKKSSWMKTNHEETFMGSCWYHSTRIFKMIPNGLTVKYLPKSFLKKRNGNDSFMDKGFVHRLSISIDGYHHIAAHFFGPFSPEAFHIRRVLKNELHLPVIIFIGLDIKNKEEQKRYIALIKKMQCDDPIKRLFSVCFLRFIFSSYGKFLTSLLKVLFSLVKSFRQLVRTLKSKNNIQCPLN